MLAHNGFSSDLLIVLLLVLTAFAMYGIKHSNMRDPKP